MGLADLYVDRALGFSLGWAAWVRLCPLGLPRVLLYSS